MFGGLGGATRAGAALGHRQAACDARGNPHAGPREGLPPRRSLLSRLHSPVLAQNKQEQIKDMRMMLVIYTAHTLSTLVGRVCVGAPPHARPHIPPTPA